MNGSLEILRWLEENPTEARTISAAGKLDRSGEEMPEVRIAIVRNYSVELGLHHLKVECYRAHLRPSLYVGQFDNVQQEVLNSSSDLYAFKPDVVVVALRLHTLVPKLIYSFSELAADAVHELTESVLERLTGIVQAIRARSTCVILVHNFELAAIPAAGLLDAQRKDGQQNTIRRLNLSLIDVVTSTTGAYIVDVDHMMAQDGYNRALDDKFWHLCRSPYSLAFQGRLAVEYTKFIRALKGKNKKCLVLDCDNTLWGGVIGEDGIHGIKLGPSHPGSAFLEFQAAIIELYQL